jgi:hypothetical protein
MSLLRKSRPFGRIYPYKKITVSIKRERERERERESKNRARYGEFVPFRNVF